MLLEITKEELEITLSRRIDREVTIEITKENDADIIEVFVLNGDEKVPVQKTSISTGDALKKFVLFGFADGFSYSTHGYLQSLGKPVFLDNGYIEYMIQEPVGEDGMFVVPEKDFIPKDTWGMKVQHSLIKFKAVKKNE